jgi:hypothetical protein
MWFSMMNDSLIEVDLATSLVLFVMCIMYWLIGGGLMMSLEKVTGKSGDSEVVPGKSSLLALVLVSCMVMTFRTILWSVEDMARLIYAKEHITAEPYWRLMYFLQQGVEIVGTCTILGCINLIQIVETEVELSPECQNLQEEEDNY